MTGAMVTIFLTGFVIGILFWDIMRAKHMVEVSVENEQLKKENAEIKVALAQVEMRVHEVKEWAERRVQDK